MTEVFKNGLAYFFTGVKDCLYGFYEMYRLQRLPTEVPVEVKQPKNLTVLAQRRAAAAPAVTKEAHEPKITRRIFQCCLWNGGIFWLSLVLFDFVFVPFLMWITHSVLGNSPLYSKLWLWMGPMLSAIFGALWVLPLFIVSKVVNSLWFQDIADAAWGTKKWQQKLPNIGLLLADMLFSIVVQTLFLLQSMVANMLPIPLVGQIVSLLHLALLYSLYSFEYKWINMGWSIQKRVAQLEHQWPYFLGFGLPLAYLTWLPQSAFISGCIFAIFFPILIISANEAPPIRYKYDFPLHLFGVVMAISNTVFSKSLSKTTRPRP